MRNSMAFSLLELLIAVMITGILVAVSYPAYQQYSLKSYRTEAIQNLLYLAGQQEAWRAEFGHYTTDISALAPAGSLGMSGRYRFSITLISEPQQGFVVTAEAQSLQLADQPCLIFTLNQYGQRNAGNSQAQQCWQ